MTEKNYNFVLIQEKKLAKSLFSLKTLPSNIFLNKRTGDRVLVPGYYASEDVADVFLYLK